MEILCICLFDAGVLAVVAMAALIGLLTGFIRGGLFMASWILALVLTLPMLAFVADILGLVGGGLMAWVSLDISPAQYVERLHEAITMSSFWVGIIKAPAFAMVIALVGCHEGLKVTGSAESVGLHTTRSVVQSIFLVIVFDALFSIFFSVIGF